MHGKIYGKIKDFILQKNLFKKKQPLKRQRVSLNEYRGGTTELTPIWPTGWCSGSGSFIKMNNILITIWILEHLSYGRQIF